MFSSENVPSITVPTAVHKPEGCPPDFETHSMHATLTPHNSLSNSTSLRLSIDPPVLPIRGR